MISKKNLHNTYKFIIAIYAIGYIIGIILLSIEVNKYETAQMDSENNVYKCYSQKKINDYGNLHKNCNSNKFNRSKYFDLPSNDIEECKEVCPTYECIEKTQINIFNETNINKFETYFVRFNACFENIDTDYLTVSCKGMEKCDNKKYEKLYNSYNNYLFGLMLLTIVGILPFFYFTGYYINYRCDQCYSQKNKSNPNNNNETNNDNNENDHTSSHSSKSNSDVFEMNSDESLR